MIDSITRRSEREAKAAQDENARRVAEHARALQQAVATGLPADQMLERLAEATEVNANDLRELAQARAQSVRDYFTNVGKIAPDRLFLARDKVDPASEAKGARVSLGLQ
jgi:hypothetical protein